MISRLNSALAKLEMSRKSFFLGLAGLLLLSACVISSDEIIFKTGDFRAVDAVLGAWRQVEASEGYEEEAEIQIAALGNKVYRATSYDPGFEPDDDDDPVDFSLVPLGGKDYILVSPEVSEDEVLVVYLGFRITHNGFTTYMFGGGTEEAEEAAFQTLLEAVGLSSDPEFSFEVRLPKGAKRKDLKNLFRGLMADPDKYGGYWVRYEPVDES